jgi:amino acid permease
MNTKHDTAAEHHAAKRHWLNSHEAGYHKAMGNRQVQMIAIGGAIGTGLFLGAGARLQMAGPALALVYLVCGIFSSLFFAPSANWFSTAPRAAASSPMPGNSSVKKPLRGRLDVLR